MLRERCDATTQNGIRAELGVLRDIVVEQRGLLRKVKGRLTDDDKTLTDLIVKLMVTLKEPEQVKEEKLCQWGQIGSQRERDD